MDSESNNAMIYVLFSKTIYLFSSQFICSILKRKKVSYMYSDKSTMLLSIIPAISIVIMLCFSFISININFSENLNLYFTISIILLLLINMFTFYIQQIIVKKNDENIRLLLELQRESDSVQYYNTLKENYEKQRILIHDIREHLNTIASLNNGNHVDQISKYIKDLSNSDVLKMSKTYCKNPVFNAILSRYAQICENEGIAFSTDIRHKTLEYFPTNYYTSLFGNLLDNAVAAAKETPEAFIECNVSLIQNGNADLINIINSCETNPISSDGSLITTKTDKINHGLGISSVKRIVDKYDGIIDYSYNNEEHYFKFSIVIQHPSVNSL